MTDVRNQESAADSGAVEEDPAFERLLEFLRESRGFDFTGYKRTSLERRIRRRMERSAWPVRRLRRPPRGPPRRVHRAVQHHPDQRHRLLPRPGAWETSAEVHRPSCCPKRRRADPGVERRLRGRAGGVLAGDGAAPRRSGPRVPGAGEDLRHRRRRGGAGAGAHGGVHRPRDAGLPAGAARKLLRRGGRPVRLRAGAAPRRDLRAQRPVQDAPISRIDLLVCRNTLMYFNARDAGAHPAPLHSRCGPRGALPRQGRDAAHPRRAVRAGRLERRFFRKRLPLASAPTGAAAPPYRRAESIGQQAELPPHWSRAARSPRSRSACRDGWPSQPAGARPARG